MSTGMGESEGGRPTPELVETAWVKPAYATGGLDQLGTQAPCIFIYGQLLPGITNVTDRARYYSFYPWFFWAYDQRNPTVTAERFLRDFRRADCLLSFISERHADACAAGDPNDDGARHHRAMVGRNTIEPALRRVAETGEPLRLSDFATREDDEPKRYFQNAYGGYGQYYAGTLIDMGITAAAQAGLPRYTADRGVAMARAFDEGVDGEAFFSALERDVVSLRDLDSLAGFCACGAREGGAEHNALMDLMFDRPNQYGAAGAQRRDSLLLLLDLVRGWEGAEGDGLGELGYRGGVYGASLPSGRPWPVSESLLATRSRWEVYARSDLFSFAAQACFSGAVGLLMRDLEVRLRDADAFADWVVAHPAVTAEAGHLWETPFISAVERAAADAPPLEHWEHEHHELERAEQLRRYCAQGAGQVDAAYVLIAALRLLIQLAGRDAFQAANPYGDVELTPAYRSDYPLNLFWFVGAVSRWRNSEVATGEVLRELISDHLTRTHWKVALRKLRHQSTDTFKLRPTETGLHAVETPTPVFTTPRFRQALQIVRDLGLVFRETGKAYHLTDLGRQVLGESGGL